MKTLILLITLTIAGCYDYPMERPYYSPSPVGTDAYDAYMNAYRQEGERRRRRENEWRQQEMERKLNDLWIKSLNQ